ncbi:MAG: OFA family MFS transporter [Alkalibacterium thalassium]|nr:OFA family MFS transporter [Alkalibacterium thalassium]
MEQSSERWKVLLGGVMMQLCIGGIYTWSLFNQPLVDAFGWERTEVYTAYSLIIFIFAFVTIFSGRLQDRIGPRLVGTIGMICFSAGLIIASQARSLPVLYLGYSLLGGIGVGMVYVCPLSTGLKWYPRKKGMVTGIIIGAFGMGGFIFNFVLSALISSIGVSQTFLVQGLVYALVGITGAQMLKVPTQSESKHVLVNENDYTTKGMLKTPAFYLLWIMYFTGSLSGLLVIGLSQDIARDLVGLSPATAGYAVAVAAVFNVLGRLGWGALSDLIGRLRVFTLLFGLTAVSMAALSLFQLNAFTYFAILGIIVSCFGGFLATFPAVCSDISAPTFFGSNYGLLYQAYGISALIGPLLLSAVS